MKGRNKGVKSRSRLRLFKLKQAISSIYMTTLSPTSNGISASARPDVVLVISRNPDTRFLFKVLLEFLGYSCLEANDLHECYQILENLCPDLMLMEINFSVEEDIRSLSKSSAQTYFGSIPVVLISNYPKTYFQELESIFNIHAYLIKPVSLTILESCLANVPKNEIRNPVAGRLQGAA